VKFTLEQAVKTQRECSYRSTLSLTSALDGGGWLTPGPCYFTPGEKEPGTHYIEDWVGPRASLDGCGKSRAHRDSIPVACRYVDYAIPAHLKQWLSSNKSEQPFICQKVWSWVYNSYLNSTVPISSTYNENNARPYTNIGVIWDVSGMVFQEDKTFSC
jgi:hypothetical protein